MACHPNKLMFILFNCKTTSLQIFSSEYERYITTNMNYGILIMGKVRLFVIEEQIQYGSVSKMVVVSVSKIVVTGWKSLGTV